MAYYKLANLAESTLAADITDIQTSCAVATGEGAFFPSSGDFICLIHKLNYPNLEREFIKVAARTGDGFTTIVREFIDAARFPKCAHAAGSAIGLVIPAELLEEIETAVDGKLANIVEDTTPQLGGNLDPNSKLIGPTSWYSLGNMGATPTVAFGTNGYYQKGVVDTSWTSPLVLTDVAVTQTMHLLLVKSNDATERTVQWTGVTWLNSNALSTLGTTPKARFLVDLVRVAASDWLASYATAGVEP